MQKSVSKIKIFLSVAATVLLVLFVAYFKDFIKALSFVFDILSPAFLGLLLALLLNAPMRLVENKLLFALKRKSPHLARLLALFLSYALFISVVVLFLRLLLPELISSLSNLIESLPAFVGGVFEFLEKILGDATIDDNVVKELTVAVLSAINNLLDSFLKMTPDIIKLSVEVFGVFSDLFFALAFSGYILFDKEEMKLTAEKFVSKVVPTEYREEAVCFLRRALKSFDDFYAGQLIEACILGALCFLGMLALGIPYAPLVAGIVGITAIVPLLGAIVGTASSVIIIMIDSPPMAVVFLVFIVVLQMIEGNLIYPKVVGTKIDLPPFYVLFALLLGGGLFGIYGILTIVPLSSVIYKDIKSGKVLSLSEKIAKKQENSEKDVKNRR